MSCTDRTELEARLRQEQRLAWDSKDQGVKREAILRARTLRKQLQSQS